MMIRVVRNLCILLCFLSFWPTGVRSQTHPASAIPEDKRRYLCTALLNTSEGDEWGLDLIKQTAALGCNAVMITVRWDVVHRTPTSVPNWTQYDNQVNLAKSLGLKIFFRFHLERSGNRYEGYWSSEDAMRDERGRILKGMISMAHKPSIDQGLAFVKEACNRYLSLQKSGDILCTAVTTSPTQEAGYHYDENDGTNNYHTLYDYSPHMINGFRTWLKGKYSSVVELNKAWTTDYDKIDDVIPVRMDDVGTAVPRYLDWYIYRHIVLKNFLDAASKAIKEVDGSFKVVNDFGSTWDALTPRRTTFAFKNLAENTDGTKVNDSGSYPHYFSSDLLRSNTPAGKWIMNEAFHDPWSTMAEVRGFLETNFEAGCKLVNIVVATQNNIDFYAPNIKYIAEKVLSKPMTPIVPAASMVVKLSELVKKGGYNNPGYSYEWAQKKVAGRVNIRLVEDLLGEKEQNQVPILQTSLNNYSIVSGFELNYAIPSNTFKDLDGEIKSYEVVGLPEGLYWQNGVIKGVSNKTGIYTITVKAYDNDGGVGTTTFTITLKAPKQARIDIYKAGTSQTRTWVRTLKTADSINTTFYTFSINFFATPPDTSVKAVRMTLKGNVNQQVIETDLPFGLFGDNGGAVLPAGNYQLIVENFGSTNINASTALGIATYNFKVSNTKLNTAPTLTNPLIDQQAKLNNAYTFTLPANTFSDKDGQVVKFNITGLPPGLYATNNQISGIPTQVGTYTVTVEAFDNNNASVQTQFKIVVTASNLPPILVNAITDQFVVVNTPYTYAVPLHIFRDIDGYISRISVSTLPAGLNYTNGRIIGTPTATGTYTISIKVFDNEGASVEASYKLYVKTQNDNLSPILVGNIADQEAVVSQAYKYQIPASIFRDPEGETIKFAVQGLPIGLSLNNNIIEGKAEVGGTFTITVRGFDSAGNFAETSFQLTVKLSNGNMPPIVETHISDQDATIGESFKFQIPLSTFTDPDGIIATMIVRGRMPNGLTYKDGIISGIPLTAGNFTITVRAIDNNGAVVEDYFVIRVASPAASVSYSLFKAGGSSSRKFIQIIKPQSQLVVSQLPFIINIFAETKLSIDYMQFDLSGPVSYSFKDVAAPYGVYGDNDGFRPKIGSYKLRVLLFKNNQVINSHSIEFEIVADAATAGGGSGESAVESKQVWSASPNPFYESLLIDVPAGYNSTDTHFSLINLVGHKTPISHVQWNDQKVLLNMGNLSLSKGVYLLHINHSTLSPKTIKVVKGE